MFKLQVVNNVPLTSISDINTVAETFLIQIGYISDRYNPRTLTMNIRDSIPYRLFMDYLVSNPSKAWSIEELSTLLKTSKPTVYRYIDRLKMLDFLEVVDVKYKEQPRKGYRIRFGDLTKAWKFTVENVNMAIENYGKTVEHFQLLANKRREGLDDY
ncbi:MAG: HTH domain-containing protein [archaeon]|nr:HTH domain-containing protein [archaeon]